MEDVSRYWHAMSPKLSNKPIMDDPASLPYPESTACPPRLIIELACLRPDDDYLLAHLARCNRCSGFFDGAMRVLFPFTRAQAPR